tara:strand:- start:3271 stop:3750 length:480 start_codon:yes stop_codon:yes gene_type:complete
MMNTLANHGFLPRDGRNITRENAVSALKGGLNFNGTLGSIMWDQAIIANPEPNATFSTLDQLNVHGVLEHDASMTRTDAFLGNNHIFNETVYNASKQWWTDETVTAKQLAHSKIFRQIQSRATIRTIASRQALKISVLARLRRPSSSSATWMLVPSTAL